MAANLELNIASYSTEEIQQLILELQRSKADLEARRFVEQGIAQLAAALRWQTDDTLSTWADRLLETIASLVNGLQACLYMTELSTKNSPTLIRIGAYASEEEGEIRIPFGVGLIGQVAKTAKSAFYDKQSKLIAKSSTGIATIQPQNLLILPLIYNEQVEGVLEITAAHSFTPEQQELLTCMPFSESIGASLMSIRSQEEMKRLFLEAQVKSEELQAQEEEMRQNMEELQATQEEMRRQQQVILENEGKLNAIINSFPGIIFSINKNYQIQNFNQAASEWLHQTKQTIQLNQS
ncbi:MAG: GAF domain-containing protein, partial [Bacteroidia bacterium]|nr:GAF domain-containing protein [Bacteroidia bacterium]